MKAKTKGGYSPNAWEMLKIKHVTKYDLGDYLRRFLGASIQADETLLVMEFMQVSLCSDAHPLHH